MKQFISHMGGRIVHSGNKILGGIMMKSRMIILSIGLLSLLGFAVMGLGFSHIEKMDSDTIINSNLFAGKLQEKQEAVKCILENFDEIKQELQHDPEGFLWKEYLQRNAKAPQSLANNLDISSEENIGIPYKISFITEKQLLDYENTGQLTMNQEAWEVPILDAQGNLMTTSIAAYGDGKWTLALIGAPLSEEMVQLSSDEEAIKGVLQQNHLTEIQAIKHIRFPFVLDAFYIILKNNEDCLIPISHHPLLELEDLQVYEVQRVIDQIFQDRTENTAS